MGSKKLTARFAISLVEKFAHVISFLLILRGVCLADPATSVPSFSAPLEQVLLEVSKREPAYAAELRLLATKVPSAHAALEAKMKMKTVIDMLLNVPNRGDILVAAFENSGRDFNILKQKWPRITQLGRLFCSMRDENGSPHLIGRPLDENYIKGCTVGYLKGYDCLGNDAGVIDTLANAYSIESINGRDTLILKEWRRGDTLLKTQQVSTKKARMLSGGGFELVEDKTEVLSWPRAPEQSLPSRNNAAQGEAAPTKPSEPKSGSPQPPQAIPTGTLSVPSAGGTHPKSDPKPTGVPREQSKVEAGLPKSMLWAIMAMVLLLVAGACLVWASLRKKHNG